MLRRRENSEGFALTIVPSVGGKSNALFGLAVVTRGKLLGRVLSGEAAGVRQLQFEPNNVRDLGLTKRKNGGGMNITVQP